MLSPTYYRPTCAHTHFLSTSAVKNHTVTQSSFPEPCARLADTYNTPTGFDSGLYVPSHANYFSYLTVFVCSMPVAPTVTSEFPTFLVTVSDTAPIWGYCRQFSPAGTIPATHCQAGMVFAINPPPSGNTFAAYLAKAKVSTAQNSLLPPTQTSTGTSSMATSTSSAVVHDIVVGGVKADGTPTWLSRHLMSKRNLER